MDAAHLTDRVPVGRVLVERGVIDGDELERALGEQRLTGRRLGEILVGSGAITWLALAEALAAQWEPREEPEPERKHLLFGAGAAGWFLVEGDGPAPAVGDTVELAGKGGYVVAKLAPSPVRDGRRCAFLERVTPAAAPRPDAG